MPMLASSKLQTPDLVFDRIIYAVFFSGILYGSSNKASA